MKPMSAVLSKDALRKIFPCIQELVEIHEQLLGRLREATSMFPSVQISEAVLEVRIPFLVYGEYLSGISNPLETIQGVVREYPECKRILDVSIFLILPMNEARINLDKF